MSTAGFGGIFAPPLSVAVDPSSVVTKVKATAPKKTTPKSKPVKKTAKKNPNPPGIKRLPTKQAKKSKTPTPKNIIPTVFV